MVIMKSVINKVRFKIITEEDFENASNDAKRLVDHTTLFHASTFADHDKLKQMNWYSLCNSRMATLSILSEYDSGIDDNQHSKLRFPADSHTATC